MLTSKQTPEKKPSMKASDIHRLQSSRAREGTFKSDNTPKRDLIGMPPDHTQVDFIIKKDSVSSEFKSDHSTRPPTIPRLAQAVRLELLGHVIKS